MPASGRTGADMRRASINKLPQGTGEVTVSPKVEELPGGDSSTIVSDSAGGKPQRRRQAAKIARANRVPSEGSQEVSEGPAPEDAGTEAKKVPAATPAPAENKKDRSVVQDENSGTQPATKSGCDKSQPRRAHGDTPCEAGPPPAVPHSRVDPSPGRYAHGPEEYGQFWDGSATADGSYLWPGDQPPWPFAPAYGGVLPPPPYNPFPSYPPAYAPCPPRGVIWPPPFPYQAPPYAPFWPAAYSGYPLAYAPTYAPAYAPAYVDPVLPYPAYSAGCAPAPYAASAAPDLVDLPQQYGAANRAPTPRSESVSGQPVNPAVGSSKKNQDGTVDVQEGRKGSQE